MHVCGGRGGGLKHLISSLLFSVAAKAFMLSNTLTRRFGMLTLGNPLMLSVEGDGWIQNGR